MARIQIKRGTAAQWTAANPILRAGEAGFETDTGKLKVGNGTAAWAVLPYISSDGGGGVAATKESIGLGAVDNTSDLAKPVSTATQAEIDTKQNLVTLTTDGTDGAATFDQSTGALNIPNYATGGGGGGEITVGSLFTLDTTGGNNYNATNVNGAGVLSGRVLTIRTLSTGGAYSAFTSDTPSDPQFFENFNLWQTKFRASAAITNSQKSSDGIIVWGVGNGLSSATNFTPYRFVGFKVDRTAGVDTWFAVSGDGTDATTTELAPLAYPYVAHWYLSVKKTLTAVEFWRNGVLVATHTTAVAGAGAAHNQSNPIFVLIGNKSAAQNHQIGVIGHRVDFVADL